ncbi:MAG: hypothetical protein OHK0045_14460 [Raineya sp.]
MKKNALPLLGFLFLLLGSTFAQNNEKNKVMEPIYQLFEGMRKGDSALVRNTFHVSARMQTIAFNSEQKPTVVEESLEKFLRAIASPHPEIYDERIRKYEVRIDDNLASVWTEYEFYVGERFSHCGVNAFQLAKNANNEWKIIQVADTRRKEPCKGQKKKKK